jgi:hypothetical protein
VNWFWDTLWKWFGEREPKLPPVPRDENMKGLGWRGDRRDTKPFSPVSEDEERKRRSFDDDLQS